MTTPEDPVAAAGRREAAGLVALALLQLVLWFLLTIHTATSDARGVFGFLVLMALLFVAYGASLVLVRETHGDRRVLLGALTAALLFRVVQLHAGLPEEDRWNALSRDLAGRETGYETFLLFDNDAWRYLWDGAMLAGGESPYAKPPLQLEEEYLELDEPMSRRERLLTRLFEETLWVEVYDNLSFTGYRTVYGPVAMGSFALSHALRPGSMFTLKVLMTAAEFGVCLLLLFWLGSRGFFAVLAYSWNPLVIKEVAGSGHVDGLLVVLLLAAVLALERQSWWLSGTVAALATAVKVSAAPVLGVLLAFSWARSGGRAALRLVAGFAVTSVLCFAPFRSDFDEIVSALSVFAREWAFNPGPWLLVRHVAGWSAASVASSLALATVLAAVLVAVMRGEHSTEDLCAALLATTLTIVWFSSTVNPWYLIWSLPFAAFLRWWPLLVLCAAVQASYVFYLDQTERGWLLFLEHGLFVLACVGWWLRRRR